MLVTAVQGHHGRRLAVGERHLAGVERLHPAADRLEHRLLARPGAQERGRPVGRGEGVELVALPAAEEPVDHALERGERAISSMEEDGEASMPVARQAEL